MLANVILLIEDNFNVFLNRRQIKTMQANQDQLAQASSEFDTAQPQLVYEFPIIATFEKKLMEHWAKPGMGSAFSRLNYCD